MIDYKENIDYNFVEVNGSFGLKILTGEFAGVIYQYENITVQDAPETEPDSAVLGFGFVVVDPVNIINEKFFDLEFKTIIGDILLSILQKNNSEEAENDVEFEQIDFEEPEF